MPCSAIASMWDDSLRFACGRAGEEGSEQRRAARREENQQLSVD